MTAEPKAGATPAVPTPPPMPWVSIVMPVFNKRPHVARAIESVLAQQDPDFALIIVCDPSTDGSEEVVAEFDDRRIQVLRREQPGPGGYAARNLGIRTARTEWIAFLDADDEWLPDHLAQLRRLAWQFPSAAMLSAGWRVQDAGTWHDAYWTTHQSSGNHLISAEAFLIWEARGARPVWTGVACLRKALLVQSGGFPEGDIARSGDLDAWLRCVMAGGGLAWSAHVGAVYYRDTQHMVTRHAAVNFQVHLDTTAKLLAGQSHQRIRRLLAIRQNNMLINAWVSNIHLPHEQGFRLRPWLRYRALVFQDPGHALKCLGYDVLSALPGAVGRWIHRNLAWAKARMQHPGSR